jgi:hypothetical protein
MSTLVGNRNRARIASRYKRQSSCAIFATIVLAVAVHLFPAQAAAEPSDTWTAVTVARSSWGAATAYSLSQAIALAVRDCRSKTTRPSDCGAEIKTIKAGYIVAMRCGNYRALISADTLDDAEFALAQRILQLRYISKAALGPCVRIIQVQAPHSPDMSAIETGAAQTHW